MTQTTAGRITEIIREHLKFYAGSGEWAAAVEAGQEIAAEIDALTRERDEARAEVDRLRPAAEAWEASRAFSDLMGMDASDPTADGYRPVTDDEIIAASIACQKADAAARAAKVTP